MNPRGFRYTFARTAGLTGLALLLAALLTPSAAAGERLALTDLPFQLQQDLEAPLRAKLGQLASEKNAQGLAYKSGTYSRLLTKVDDANYRVSMVVKTAGDTGLTVEQMQLNVQQDPAKKRKWSITSEEVVGTFDGLRRNAGYACYPFESFAFDREGLTLAARNGGVCEFYYEGEVGSFLLVADQMSYDYKAPKYLDYYQTHRFLLNDYPKVTTFTPQAFEFSCDGYTCEAFLESNFTGLSRRPAAERTPTSAAVPAGIHDKVRSYVDRYVKEIEKQRRDDPFADFRRPYTPERRTYTAEVRKSATEGLGVTYDNWAGFEVQFWVEIDWPDLGHVTAPVYGYYTEGTLASSDPYDLERRDDMGRRFYDLAQVEGEVEAGLDDPEILRGDIRYKVNIREDLQLMEFFVATKPRENVKRPSLFINSVEYADSDLMWVQTSPFQGMIVFPEQLKAGSQIDLRIVFASRAIEKINPAFSRTPRGGWLPLVIFGDFIDTMDLTLKVPDRYTPLGIGQKISEKVKEGVRITRWTADNPVEFPSIIFGKYNSDEATIEAKKLDGTKIPVRVHVDEVSMMQLNIDARTQQDAEEATEAFSAGARGIRGKQLRPIAEQAAGAINLFTEISGIDYPYGELNIVNDPAPALYGQAPSSLIYLGSFVFRGEGTMAGDTLIGGGGTNIAKFLKSVVAHEVGHQWWGSRVANANSRNYWFVESLAEYFSALYLERVFGRKEYDEQVEEWRRVVLNRDLRSSVQNASVLWPGEDLFGSYQAAVYNKGPYAFHMLREIFGDEKFFAALKQFCQELTEKGEIVTRDIQRAAERAFGGVGPDGNPYNADLSWFFDQWIRGTGLPQYAMAYNVRQTEDGNFVIEGKVKQRVVVGSKAKYHVMDDTYFRGLVPIVAKGKKNQYTSKIVVEGPETPFALKVPERPVEVSLNERGTLALDVLVNKDF